MSPDRVVTVYVLLTILLAFAVVASAAHEEKEDQEGEEAAAVSLSLPTPVIAFQVNPNPARKEHLLPTCNPYVLDTSTAFWCYHDLDTSMNYAGVTSPSSSSSSSALGYPVVEFGGAQSYFDLTPIPISPTSAVFGTNFPATSSWAAASTTSVIGPFPRANCTSTPAVDPVRHVAYIPFGVMDASSNYDLMEARNLTDLNQSIRIGMHVWFNDGEDRHNLIHDVFHYEGYVFVMHNNTFYKLNETTLQPSKGTFVVHDPCRVGLRAQNGMRLRMITYGTDPRNSSLPLTAFLVYGNTTNESRAEFVMCRVSHLTGVQKWNRTIADDFDVLDVTGGGESIALVTGYAASTKPLKLVTLVTNVLTGHTYGSVLRQAIDEASFPLFVPNGTIPLATLRSHHNNNNDNNNSSSVTCGPAFILQVAGAVTAYCVDPFVVYRQPIRPAWTATSKCFHRPAYDPVTKSVVCLAYRNTVVSLSAATGALVWQDSRNVYLTQPQVVLEVAAQEPTGGEAFISFVFVSDLDATLWGLQMALPAPTPAAASSPSGLTNDEEAGVVIGVIVGVGIIGFVAVLYFRFHARRRAGRRRQGHHSSAQHIAINEYGSM